MNPIVKEDPMSNELKECTNQEDSKPKICKIKESSTQSEDLNDDLHSEDSDENIDFIHGYNDGLNAFKHQQHQIINISKCTFNITNLNINNSNN